MATAGRLNDESGLKSLFEIFSRNEYGSGRRGGRAFTGGGQGVKTGSGSKMSLGRS